MRLMTVMTITGSLITISCLGRFASSQAGPEPPAPTAVAVVLERLDVDAAEIKVTLARGGAAQGRIVDKGDEKNSSTLWICARSNKERKETFTLTKKQAEELNRNGMTTFPIPESARQWLKKDAQLEVSGEFVLAELASRDHAKSSGFVKVPLVVAPPPPPLVIVDEVKKGGATTFTMRLYRKGIPGANQSIVHQKDANSPSKVWIYDENGGDLGEVALSETDAINLNAIGANTTVTVTVRSQPTNVIVTGLLWLKDTSSNPAAYIVVPFGSAHKPQ